MLNVGWLLKAHNQKVLKQHRPRFRNLQLQKQGELSIARQMSDQVNCLPGKCTIVSEDRASYSYIGLTDNAFKKHWSNHCQSFKNKAHETSTEVSKLIRRLKRADMKYTINWQIIITKCQSYKPSARTCNLCLTEKLLIIKSPTSINSRTELVSKCRHSRKFLIMHCC